jgi:hypothetical protein
VTPIPQQKSAKPLPVPKTAAELEGLISQRAELQAQLRMLSDRRAELAQQVRDAGSDLATRSGPEARLKTLDEQIVRVESQLEVSNEAIAAGKAKGLDIHQDVPPPAAPFPVMPELPQLPQIFTEVQEPGWKYFGRRVFGDGAILASIVVPLILLGVLLYWRISRSLKHQMAHLMAMQAQRLEDIQRSVDTMAVEVERVSEGQRFVTKVVGDKLPLTRD